MKKSLTSLIIKKVKSKQQSNTTSHMLERLLSKRQVVANVDKGLENRGPFHCWWGCKLIQSLWKTVWRFLKKLKMELPYDPAIPLLGIQSKETKH